MIQSQVEYRTIPECDGYRFGSDGTAWTCWESVGKKGTGGGLWVKSNTWRKIKGTVNRDGYIKVHLKINGVRRHTTLHRLILRAFSGPCPAGMEGCHNNGNPSDNRACNLRWDTPSENQQDALRHGTRRTGLSSVGATYISLWNSCQDLTEFCSKTGKTRRNALCLASFYRSQGYYLKFFPRPSPTTALAGQRFGRWVVVEVMRGNKRFCRCDCGKERIVAGATLVNGTSISCSCSRLPA